MTAVKKINNGLEPFLRSVKPNCTYNSPIISWVRDIQRTADPCSTLRNVSWEGYNTLDVEKSYAGPWFVGLHYSSMPDSVKLAFQAHTGLKAAEASGPSQIVLRGCWWMCLT